MAAPASIANVFTKVCAHCHKEGNDENPLLECPRCEITFYCGSDHLGRDWATHKTVCRLPSGTEPFLRMGDVALAVGEVDGCDGIKGNEEYALRLAQAGRSDEFLLLVEDDVDAAYLYEWLQEHFYESPLICEGLASVLSEMTVLEGGDAAEVTLKNLRIKWGCHFNSVASN
jgi:hypothetical protein